MRVKYPPGNSFFFFFFFCGGGGGKHHGLFTKSYNIKPFCFPKIDVIIISPLTYWYFISVVIMIHWWFQKGLFLSLSWTSSYVHCNISKRFTCIDYFKNANEFNFFFLLMYTFLRLCLNKGREGIEKLSNITVR